MGRLDGKVALVTGGARGMGEAHVRRFAAEGARVVVTDVRDAEGRAVARDLGDRAAYVRLDVTREDDWSRAVGEATTRFGRLDVLVNNAGIASAKPLEATSLAEYRAVIEVNQVGVFLGMRAAVAPMTAAGGGSIVNISSIDGLVGMSLCSAYVASKFAVRGMTKVAALELAGRGIRVNSIHPGSIETPMSEMAGNPEALRRLEEWVRRRTPLARLGQPSEVSHLAVFLASDESAYCTGSEFVLDGGMLAGEMLPL